MNGVSPLSKTETQTATAVVIHKDGQHVLLHKREDFRFWSLPGGGVDAGETPEQAALRETMEETGYQIEIAGYVGVYQRPQFHETRFVYRARVIGGEVIERGPEALMVDRFLPEALPARLGPSIGEIVADAISAAVHPLRKTIRFPVWQVWAVGLMIG